MHAFGHLPSPPSSLPAREAFVLPVAACLPACPHPPTLARLATTGTKPRHTHQPHHTHRVGPVDYPVGIPKLPRRGPVGAAEIVGGHGRSERGVAAGHQRASETRRAAAAAAGARRAPGCCSSSLATSSTPPRDVGGGGGGGVPTCTRRCARHNPSVTGRLGCAHCIAPETRKRDQMITPAAVRGSHAPPCNAAIGRQG